MVVSRYFGGVKLGTGGLVRAYGQAVRDVIEQSELIRVEPRDRIDLEFPYDQAGWVNLYVENLTPSKSSRFMASVFEWFGKWMRPAVISASRTHCAFAFRFGALQAVIRPGQSGNFRQLFRR